MPRVVPVAHLVCVDIVDGNITFLLAMTWSLARTYQIARVTTLAEPKPDATVTAVSLEECSLSSHSPLNSLRRPNAMCRSSCLL